MSAIYGLFNKNGECLYVGRTNNPGIRAESHRKRFRRATFQIISEVPREQAEAEEYATIARFRAIGQAKANRATPTSFKVPLARQIVNLKPRHRFSINGKKARNEANRAIKTLRDAGVLTVEVITRETDKTEVFNVIAL
jgi:hypothetical protein